ncbi:uncharacterized protein L969DRAFT_94630 [Mixia osmundae IAM 14324]|uniref:Major facilitator superfamily (MFS) profile domain-containing protein n=1 Tax=Mixia osmundae (strain CBS 9802 / IAM 14324 / JCM 22182 / KY 12970) TaxID=764103 RepID=G7DVY3_MIXOS|nr:uncharacterized protein L969DRAFT_94630 [Mixia osmundae IAM 14324]KEI39576.1 hypothetical protein L969DRAFT_94630 [Mixia osmundae IAM 14324]GAA94743.1 hypothetical protein E5Q_01397 [Mixia osmundae IAM 14324]
MDTLSHSRSPSLEQPSPTSPIDKQTSIDKPDNDQQQSKTGAVQVGTYDATSANGIPLTTYERKALLINKELDIIGMGRYQWCLFFLCGMGYFLDLLWAQAFGLLASPLSIELNVQETIGNIFTAFSVGLTVGALFWGLAADVLGRRLCFNLTCLIAGIFGTIFGAISNFDGLLFITAVIGLGIGGNIPLDSLLVLEFIPNNRRILLALLSLFQPLGVVVSCAIAYGLIPPFSCDASLPACGLGQEPCCTKASNYGWRYMTYTLGGITIIVFILRFVVFDLQESPKFLLAQGREAEAIAVLEHIAHFNKRPSPELTLEDFDRITNESTEATATDEDSGKFRRPLTKAEATRKVVRNMLGRFKHLKGIFANRFLSLTFVLLAIGFMAEFWAFNIAGGFLPLILRNKGIAADVSIYTTYQHYLIIYGAGGVPGVLLGAFLLQLPLIGRKWGMVISAALMAVSLFLFTVINSQAGNVVFNLLEYLFQSALNAILYAFVPEIFPAQVRGSASGMLSTLGRLSGIIAPIAATQTYKSSTDGVLYLAGGGALVAMVAFALLPFETRGRQTY